MRATRKHRGNPDTLSEPLWAFLLENLTGTQGDISLAELRALDVASTFPTREVTWDEEPMVAIRLPNQRETAWILVRPHVWDNNRQAFAAPAKFLARNPEEQTQPAGPTKPLPMSCPHRYNNALKTASPGLSKNPQIRTAILLNAQVLRSPGKGPIPGNRRAPLQ